MGPPRTYEYMRGVGRAAMTYVDMDTGTPTVGVGALSSKNLDFAKKGGVRQEEENIHLGSNHMPLGTLREMFSLASISFIDKQMTV
ncbi:hypothetical protein CFAM422_005154 [Trichoderma lentiforme]|uniref:Uncharacterized protein n=1 Tax=Trichoderma lentiforme TaxID=1567552 RepID=A0A9P5CCM0_9HYPO|nr:hypothetical protein CFAM422_005154 [Trichoderma lentiforme]